MRELERRVLLTVLDRKWREHLYEMDYLREGIGLRAMAQRDPLVEYQREGGDMFNAMMEAFMEEVVGFVFHLEVQVQQAGRPGGCGHRQCRDDRPGSPPPRWWRAAPIRTAPGSRCTPSEETTTSWRSRCRPSPNPRRRSTRPKITAKGLDGRTNGKRAVSLLGAG